MKESIKKLNEQVDDMIDYLIYLLSIQENLKIEYEIKERK